jgi:hypothetical protein
MSPFMNANKMKTPLLNKPIIIWNIHFTNGALFPSIKRLLGAPWLSYLSTAMPPKRIYYIFFGNKINS